MTNVANSQTRRGCYALVASIMLGLPLWTVPEAIAQYRPPKTPSAPKDTGSNTTRGGCNSNRSAPLTALAPFSHAGQTSSGHPTFAWFMSEISPLPLQFRLFRANGQLLYRTQLQSQLGIVQFSLPQDEPELKAGQMYRWQVVFVCNPNPPLTTSIVLAEIKVVKSNAALQAQLAATQNFQQRIDLYTESGLWYDALAEALKAPSNSQNQSALKLLDSLAKLEAQTSKNWSDRLRQIQAIERQRQGLR